MLYLLTNQRQQPNICRYEVYLCQWIKISGYLDLQSFQFADKECGPKTNWACMNILGMSFKITITAFKTSFAVKQVSLRSPPPPNNGVKFANILIYGAFNLTLTLNWKSVEQFHLLCSRKSDHLTA